MVKPHDVIAALVHFLLSGTRRIAVVAFLWVLRVNSHECRDYENQ
jgi:hypothetical protein